MWEEGGDRYSVSIEIRVKNLQIVFNYFVHRLGKKKSLSVIILVLFHDDLRLYFYFHLCLVYKNTTVILLSCG